MDAQYRLRIVDRDVWTHLAITFLDYNYRQSWEFGTACAKRVRAASEHVAIEHPELGVVALADVRIRKIPFLGGGIAYINGGPLTCRKGLCHEAIADAVVDVLVREYVQQRRLTLRMAPPIRGNVTKGSLEVALISKGFAELASRATIVLDLAHEESEIRKRFHPKWRNHLNKSERAGLTVCMGTDLTLFEEFIPLFNSLISAKNFIVDLDADFYRRVQENTEETDRFNISLAYYQGKAVAGHVASILGDTSVYLLGAADKTGRTLDAAYLLQWQVIQLSKAAGCRWYDLGGIDPDQNPGVYDFKKRMGGEEKMLPGNYQLHPNGMRALLTRYGERFYRSLKPLLVRV